MKNIGTLGEEFVADLLKANGWKILAVQWHCCWGELDLVATDRQYLIFVEVKTRSDRNWDLNGALAITAEKQRKLFLAASEFLAAYPDLADLVCRFDVALVRNSASKKALPRLSLRNYLQSAFTVESP